MRKKIPWYALYHDILDNGLTISQAAAKYGVTVQAIHARLKKRPDLKAKYYARPWADAGWQAARPYTRPEHWPGGRRNPPRSSDERLRRLERLANEGNREAEAELLELTERHYPTHPYRIEFLREVLLGDVTEFEEELLYPASVPIWPVWLDPVIQDAGSVHEVQRARFLAWGGGSFEAADEHELGRVTHEAVTALTDQIRNASPQQILEYVEHRSRVLAGEGLCMKCCGVMDPDGAEAGEPYCRRCRLGEDE